MSVPLIFIWLQLVAVTISESAALFIWLMMDSYASENIQLEESEDNASVSEQTRQQLMALANALFTRPLPSSLTDNAQLDSASANCCCS